MKYLILVILLVGCRHKEVESKNKWNDEWTGYLSDELSKHDFSSVKVPCKNTSKQGCVIKTMIQMAKYESNYNPATKFNESGDLKGVVSRGLFQISKDSANQKVYGCNVKNENDLHDPEINTRCAVKIISYQTKKSGVLIDGSKNGCGAYWSVCRSTSKSYKKIIDSVER